MSGDLNTALARTLADEWVRAGITQACLAPGSRSTPLALALAAEPRLRVDVFLDERSAAFFGLGTARATGRPAVVLCTSGTAAAEFHPAVLEASYGRVPLVVCTADRPPELRETGAGQTVDQVKLYGGATRWFAELGSHDERAEAVAAWRPLAARAVVEALGPPSGPVHLNLAFREPLVPTGGPVPVPAGRPGGEPWIASRTGRSVPDPSDVTRLAETVGSCERGLVVAGWGADADPATVEAFARSSGWPVLADPLSGLRCGSHAVSTYDALLREPGFASTHRPEVVIRLGAPLTSRTALEWLDDGAAQVLVDPDGAWLDSRRTACERIAADPTRLLDALARRVGNRSTSAWLDGWRRADRTARAALDEFLDVSGRPFEGRVARDLVAGLPDGATLVVGSSMPVRDVEWFGPPRTGIRILANRGVNGIDGFVSTALGIAAASPGPVVALSGDLSFLHDANALIGVTRRRLRAVLVVLDNDGGGIFSFLPQATLAEFERLFATPHGVDLAALAAVHGVESHRVTSAGDLLPAVEKPMGEDGVHLVLVPTDRAENVALHEGAWKAVAGALRA